MTKPPPIDVPAGAVKAETEGPLVGAAFGSLEHLRDQAARAYAAGCELDGLMGLVSAVEALTFTRLAAAQNADRADRVTLVFLLDHISARSRLLGDGKAGDNFEAQALLMAELMAEGGDDDMADMIVACGAAISADVHKEAHRLREMIDG